MSPRKGVSFFSRPPPALSAATTSKVAVKPAAPPPRSCEDFYPTLKLSSHARCNLRERLTTMQMPRSVPFGVKLHQPCPDGRLRVVLSPPCQGEAKVDRGAKGAVGSEATRPFCKSCIGPHLDTRGRFLTADGLVGGGVSLTRFRRCRRGAPTDSGD